LNNRHPQYLKNLLLDWDTVPLEKLGTIYSGGTPSRIIPSFWDGSIAWVTPGELTKINSKWLTQTKEYITELGLSNSSTKLMPKGTILVTTRATIGSVALAAIPVCTNQGFKSIVPNEDTDSIFYYYLLQFIASEIVRLSSGSTFDEISRRDFANIVVPRPPIKEQRRIAEILDTIDEVIAYTEALIAKLKQIRTGLLHDLLTRGLDENGQLRDPIAHPEQFKDSPFGRIPKEWEVLNLESLLNGRPKNGYSPKEVDEWTGIVMLGLSCLTDEGFEPCQLKNAPLDDPKVNNALLSDGDFLLSRSNTRERVALAGIYQDIGVPCIYPDLMMQLIINEKTCNRFLELLLQYFPIRNQLTGKAQGTSASMVKISSQTVIETVVPLPDSTEQVRIIQGIDRHDSRISTESTYLEKLKQQKKGLMQDLLTGKVRVNRLAEFSS
jgi:type I restriction enzyme S subunit